MAKVEFPELPTQKALDGMTSSEVSALAATFGGFMDDVQKEYKDKMKILHDAISTKLKKEKDERDLDPNHRAKAQGIGG